jgi:hypothetical protein
MTGAQTSTTAEAVFERIRRVRLVPVIRVKDSGSGLRVTCPNKTKLRMSRPNERCASTRPRAVAASEPALTIASPAAAEGSAIIRGQGQLRWMTIGASVIRPSVPCRRIGRGCPPQGVPP